MNQTMGHNFGRSSSMERPEPAFVPAQCVWGSSVGEDTVSPRMARECVVNRSPHVTVSSKRASAATRRGHVIVNGLTPLLVAPRSRGTRVRCGPSNPSFETQLLGCVSC